MNSPFSSEVCPGPVTISSTGASRLPSGPAMTATARAAIIAGTLSAAGEALHRLPASEARPWICCRADQVDALDDAGPGAFERFVGR